MAIQNYTLTPVPWMRESGRVFVAVWVLANGDSGLPIEMALYADRSINVFGTFGAGGNLIWEGTNDPTLKDSTPPANTTKPLAARIRAVWSFSLIRRVSPAMSAED